MRTYNDLPDFKSIGITILYCVLVFFSYVLLIRWLTLEFNFLILINALIITCCASALSKIKNDLWDAKEELRYEKSSLDEKEVSRIEKILFEKFSEDLEKILSIAGLILGLGTLVSI